MGKKFVSLGLMVILIIGMVSISGCIKVVSKSLSEMKISKVIKEEGDELVSNTPVKAKISKPVERGEDEISQTSTNPEISRAIIRGSKGQTSQTPTNVTFFGGVKEGSVIRFYFLLGDKYGRNTPGDGHVIIRIFDGTNNLLYYKEFDVKASEFVDYEYKPTGQYIGKAYEWRVPISEIRKGVSYSGFGKVVLTFTTPEGRELHANTIVPIPVHTK